MHLHRDAILNPIVLSQPQRYTRVQVRENLLLLFTKDSWRVSALRIVEGERVIKPFKIAECAMLRLAWQQPCPQEAMFVLAEAKFDRVEQYLPSPKEQS